MKKRLFSLAELPLQGKTILLRVDYNVPLEQGKVHSTQKIAASLDTIHYLLRQQGTTIILATHLGEPHGKVNTALSTKLLLPELKVFFPKHKIIHLPHCIGKAVRERIQQGIKNKKSQSEQSSGVFFNLAWDRHRSRTEGYRTKARNEIFLLENLRFYAEEEENDLSFGHALASLADIYVNDAFSVCHRRHASVDAITRFLPSFPGVSLERELQYLHQVLNPQRPKVWIMGGAKLEKLEILQRVLAQADYILVGGALPFTFLKAQGISVGMSKIDAASIILARKLLSTPQSRKIVLPLDFVVAESFSMKAQTKVVPFNKIAPTETALDLGPETISHYKTYLQKAKTIVWNGPLGYVEWAKFATGTKELGRFLGKLEVLKIAGGGETADAIHKFHLESNFTHVSTGGGATLAYLAGEKLPGLRALEKNYQKFHHLVKKK